MDLNQKVTKELLGFGADIVAYGDLRELPEEVRHGLPVGICVAVSYPKEVILGITELPTQEYFEWYTKLNKRLDYIVTSGADMLQKMGFKAVAQTLKYSEMAEAGFDAALPHKTVATHAGIGWIGKCALLVTYEYGSAIRLSSIVTDAPLVTSQPIKTSDCGDCMVCTEACPAGAVSGRVWHSGLLRDEFYDPMKCRETALERSRRGFDGDETICGKCIEICPHTQNWIRQNSTL